MIHDHAFDELIMQTAAENLFFPADGISEASALTYECKCCGERVKRWKRTSHHRLHVRLLQRKAATAARKVREERIKRLARAREMRHRP